MIILLINGNAEHIPLADNSVHAVVTSPPYYGLRKYAVEGDAEIGLERVQAVMDAAGNSPVWALVGLVDLGIPAPVGEGVRKRIRTFLGLKDGETLEVMGAYRDGKRRNASDLSGMIQHICGAGARSVWTGLITPVSFMGIGKD